MTRLKGARDEHVSAMLPGWTNGSLDPTSAQEVADHLAGCAACRTEADEWRRLAVATQLASPTLTASPALLHRALRALDENEAAHTPWWRRSVLQGAVAASIALGLSAAVIFTPVGSYAQGLVTIFQPKQIVALPVSLDDLLTFRDLRDYGTIIEPAHTQPANVTSAAEATARAHLAAPIPASLPAGVAASPSFYVLDGKTASFTFSATKAAAAAHGKGNAPSPMPPSLDGSQISVTTAPAIVVTYQEERILAGSEPREGARREPRLLVVARSAVPIVKATRASIDEVQRYLLAQPGVSPKLVQSIRSIGDPTTALPIPVPMDKAASHPVTVQGTTGLALADFTGLGGGIIWQQDGVITGVGGTFTEGELLAVANSIR